MKAWHFLVVFTFGFTGLLIYLKGFFPTNAHVGSFSTYGDVPPEPKDLKLFPIDFSSRKTFELNNMGNSTYKKLVMIVVSSLRKDFIEDKPYEVSMPFLHDLISKGKAQYYTARARPPTVTLPRIKAITTGNIPNFIDVVFNLEKPSELQYDSFIHSAFSGGKSLAFYGDEIWTELFPTQFRREKGYPFSLLADFNTVDNNITSYAEKELTYPSHFDAMFLHYIGLKHLGYFVGARNSMINNKLTALDEVIKTTFEKLKPLNEKSLIVLTSDYGMSDRGSHGGITSPEILLPLVFISPNFDTNVPMPKIPLEIQQIDIAPTLSMMLGWPIPRSSTGRCIPQLIETLPQKEELHRLQYNCFQLISLASDGGNLMRDFDLLNPVDLYRDGAQAHSKWLKETKVTEHYIMAKSKYLACHDVVSNVLTSNMASYNYTAMSCGMIMVWLAYVGILYLLAVSAVFSAGRKKNTIDRSSPMTWGFLVTVGTILHSFSLISSSFLEEEHQTWYFITVTFLCVLFVCVISEVAGDYLQVKVRSNFYNSSIDKDDSFVKNRISDNLKNRRQEAQTVKEVKVEFNEDFETKKREIKPEKVTKSLTLVLIVITLIIHRVLRGMNQTGVQSAGSLDTGNWLNRPDHIVLLTIGVIIGLLVIGMLIEMLSYSSDNIRRVLVIVGLVFVYLYRVKRGAITLMPKSNQASTGNLGLWQAWVVYFIVFFLFVRAIYIKFIGGVGPKSDSTSLNAMDCVKSAYVILGALLLRPHNIWALAFNLLLYWIVFRLLWPLMADKESKQLKIGKIVLRISLCYWFSQMSYFSLGNSNSISTIDVTSGYVGISEVHKGIAEDLVIAFLLLTATYIGPIIWIMLCCADIAKAYQKDDHILLVVLATLGFLRFTPASIFAAMTASHRHHLFVWSVFSPKLLYETASTFVFGKLLFLAYALK